MVTIACEHHGLACGEQVVFSPLTQGDENHPQPASLLRQVVFVATPAIGRRSLLEDTVRDQRAQPLTEYVLRQAQALLKIDEARSPRKRVADDQERPPVANHIQ